MVKSLETLALGKLTIKCKQDQYQYDEPTDLDLMADCSDGIFFCKVATETINFFVSVKNGNISLNLEN